MMDIRPIRRRIKQYLAYNVVMWPLIVALYAPYYIFVVHFTLAQVVVWLETSLATNLLMNMVVQQAARKVIFWVERFT